MIDTDNLQRHLTQVALRYLGYRARLEAEIVTRLKLEIKRKQSGQEAEKIIPAVLERLHKMDLIDDSQFIQDFIKTQLDSKLKGPYFISRRLVQLGADRQLVNSLISQHIDSQREGQAIDSFIQRKYPQGLKNMEDRAKLSRQLIGRGFSSFLIREKVV